MDYVSKLLQTLGIAGFMLVSTADAQRPQPPLPRNPHGPVAAIRGPNRVLTRPGVPIRQEVPHRISDNMIFNFPSHDGRSIPGVPLRDGRIHDGRFLYEGRVVQRGSSFFLQFYSGMIPFPGYNPYYTPLGSMVYAVPECSPCSGLRDGGSWAFKGRERGSDTSPSIHIDKYVEQMNIYQGTGPQNPPTVTPPAPASGPASAAPAPTPKPEPAPEKKKYVFPSRYNDCEPFTNNQLDDYGIEILEYFLLAVDDSTNGRIRLVPKEPHGPRDKDWTLNLRDLNKGNAVVARIDIRKYAGKNGKPTDTPSRYISSVIQELGKTGIIPPETFNDVSSNFVVRYRNPCTVSGYATAPTQGLAVALSQGYALAPKTPAAKKKPASKRTVPK